MRQALETLADEGAAVAVIGDSTFDFPSVTVDNHGAAATLAEGSSRPGINDLPSSAAQRR